MPLNSHFFVNMNVRLDHNIYIDIYIYLINQECKCEVVSKIFFHNVPLSGFLLKFFIIIILQLLILISGKM